MIATITFRMSQFYNFQLVLIVLCLSLISYAMGAAPYAGDFTRSLVGFALPSLLLMSFLLGTLHWSGDSGIHFQRLNILPTSRKDFALATLLSAFLQITILGMTTLGAIAIPLGWYHWFHGGSNPENSLHFSMFFTQIGLISVAVLFSCLARMVKLGRFDLPTLVYGATFILSTSGITLLDLSSVIVGHDRNDHMLGVFLVILSWGLLAYLLSSITGTLLKKRLEAFLVALICGSLILMISSDLKSFEINLLHLNLIFLFTLVLIQCALSIPHGEQLIQKRLKGMAASAVAAPLFAAFLIGLCYTSSLHKDHPFEASSIALNHETGVAYHFQDCKVSGHWLYPYKTGYYQTVSSLPSPKKASQAKHSFSLHNYTTLFDRGVEIRIHEGNTRGKVLSSRRFPFVVMGGNSEYRKPLNYKQGKDPVISKKGVQILAFNSNDGTMILSNLDNTIKYSWLINESELLQEDLTTVIPIIFESSVSYQSLSKIPYLVEMDRRNSKMVISHGKHKVTLDPEHTKQIAHEGFWTYFDLSTTKRWLIKDNQLCRYQFNRVDGSWKDRYTQLACINTQTGEVDIRGTDFDIRTHQLQVDSRLHATALKTTHEDSRSTIETFSLGQEGKLIPQEEIEISLTGQNLWIKIGEAKYPITHRSGVLKKRKAIPVQGASGFSILLPKVFDNSDSLLISRSDSSSPFALFRFKAIQLVKKNSILTISDQNTPQIFESNYHDKYRFNKITLNGRYQVLRQEGEE